MADAEPTPGEARVLPLDRAWVLSAALSVGFHKAGLARAEPLDPGPLDRMLERGCCADMVWIGATRRERLDPSLLLPGVKSVLVLALGYGVQNLEDAQDAEGAQNPADAEEGTGRTHGLVARYARGRDYHAVMKKKLARLSALLRERDPEVRLFPSSDVTPVMEKAWAERAGIGWVGKNGCLITPELGSWVLLATVLIDRALEPDPPHPRHCGACDACFAACPTGAIVEDGLIDAGRCISFQTIERRGEIPLEVAERNRRWVFGCDDCQTACPWNAARGPARLACDPELQPRPGQSRLELGGLLALTLDGYRARFYGTSLGRARYEGLLRNAVLAAGHTGDPAWIEPVRRLVQSEFPGVRAAAVWALSRLEQAVTPGKPGDGSPGGC
jgi:epoxyqueuosine reductase